MLMLPSFSCVCIHLSSPHEAVVKTPAPAIGLDPGHKINYPQNIFQNSTSKLNLC